MLASEMARVRVLLALNIAAVIGATAAGAVTWTWQVIGIVLALYAVMNCLGVTITFHRFLSHRSFEFHAKPLERLFTMIGVLSGSGSPLGWVAIHQEHHRHSDEDGDPHSPLDGFWHVMSFDYAFKRGGFAVRRLWKDRFHRTIHEYYFGFVAAYAAVLAAAGGVSALVLGFCAPSVVTMTAQGLTNYINHVERLGYRNHETGDHSRNVWWMALINFGEGFHNNHHADPTGYTTAHRWWEVDLSGLVIRLIGIPKRPTVA